MAKAVVLGAGISGHTAALILRRELPREHEVIVIEPKDVFAWIPSNIWVGVGIMETKQVVVPLRPVYKKMGISFHQARAVEIHPDGDAQNPAPYVVAESTDPERRGQRITVNYDYLINATGPKFNYAATPGLGPDGYSESVCTYGHAEKAARKFLENIEAMKRGERRTLLVGTGHGLCTCEGAAFEYVFNVEHELRRHGVRDKARLVFLTNEAELGDFGVGGMHFKQGGFIVSSKIYAESLFTERGVEWVTGAHVFKVEPGKVSYETLDGENHELAFDYAMLLPPFAGVGLKAFAKDGADITSNLFAPNGFMKVDADYTSKTFDQWKPRDWPRTYQSPKYANIFAIGIAFAPPHQISVPRFSKKGTLITPAPPRTGQPSATMGRAVALSIKNMTRGGSDAPRHPASLADLGAACVASAGAGWRKGSAVSMTIYPIVPDFERFPHYGRDLRFTWGEIGRAGHWIKKLLHYMFIYKAKGKPAWWIIPE